MEEQKRRDTLDKLENSIEETFVDEVRVADEKLLRDKIVNLSKEIEDVEESKRTNTTLNSLKEQMKDLSGGYKDLKKQKNARLKYVILTLEERGKL